jgi:hypothetical protein
MVEAMYRVHAPSVIVKSVLGWLVSSPAKTDLSRYSVGSKRQKLNSCSWKEKSETKKAFKARWLSKRLIVMIDKGRLRPCED